MVKWFHVRPGQPVMTSLYKVYCANSALIHTCIVLSIRLETILAELSADDAKSLHGSWCILWAAFGKKLTGLGQVTELSRHKWNNLPMIPHQNRLCSSLTCCHWLEWNGDVMCELGQKNATYELLHCLLTSQKWSEVTDPRRPPSYPHWPNLHYVLRSWDRIWDSFSHRPV